MSTFADSMALLFTVFNVKPEQRNDLIKAYHAALSDIEPDDLSAAVQEYIKDGKWFPKPAELRECHERIQAEKKSATVYAPAMHKDYKSAGGAYYFTPDEWYAYADELEAEGRHGAAEYMRFRAMAFEAVEVVDALQ